MLDLDTFLTTLYVTVDEHDKTRLDPEPVTRGRRPSLSRSEVVTLALCAQWGQFGSEHAFYRFAFRHLRGAFPRLPARSQLNRLIRRYWRALVAVLRWLADELGAATCLYQVVDTTGLPTRNYKRRGVGWLPEATPMVGTCNRVGWYQGVRLLTCVSEQGVVTGFGLGEAQRKDQPLADTFFAARALPQPDLPGVGAWYGGFYLVDTGFEGRALLQHWADDAEAQVVCMPNRSRPQHGSKPWRQWLAGARQIVETVHARLMSDFGLLVERPHAFDGLYARLAAALALHNFCCWLNHQLGRPLLQFADLIDW